MTGLQQRIATAVVDDPATGVFRCRRDVFTDPDIFAREMKYIFEGNWVYLGHESQVADKNDFFATWIGRVPIILTRSKDGGISALVNACAHRGAKLCRTKRGNLPVFVCPFHGWSFRNDGRLLTAKNKGSGAYPDSFDRDGSHDLTRVRLESYRGFLFGSMNPDVAPLTDYLGETRIVIDQIVDQAPDGIEILNGSSTYIFDGNWKMQMENGCDGYHVSSVHANYASTMSRRAEDGTKAVDPNGWAKSVSGVYGFDNGHILLWTSVLNPEVRPIWSQRAALEAHVGQPRADLIIGQTRNLALYPNVFLMDQFSTQIRVVRPINVNRTEVTIYCFAPKGESAENREIRIRQYEDFFNVTGMGTPDDLEEFRSCQSAYEGHGELWNDLSRGALRWIDGADDNARAMGMTPLLSSERSEDEGLFVRQHEYWARVMLAGLARDDAGRRRMTPARHIPDPFSYVEVCGFLYREARLLDDKEWDAWLECYATDVEYWMPAWDDNGELTRDPRREISLIYYRSRQGLEDRVFRIRTARSAASQPEPRTCHTVNNVELLDRRGDQLNLRYNWHTLSHRMQQTAQYFGTTFLTLRLNEGGPQILMKKVILKDDYIHQVIDIYHI